MWLIDAEEFEGLFENQIALGNDPYHAAMDALQDATAVDAEPVRQWIPCSERMPEKNAYVIVCSYGDDMVVLHENETMLDAIQRSKKEHVTVTLGFIGSDGWYGADGFPMLVRPTFWMPLPEPPKGGADNAAD